MHQAFSVMHLSPHHFWAMTPREFSTALPRRRSTPMTRAALAALMQCFPDERSAPHG